MGGIFQSFDFSQANTSRKLLAHKRHIDGLEVPRNSLEFPMETSQSYNVIHEDIPYSCQVKQNPSKMNFYPNGTPMKKLIDEETSKRTNNRRNKPSVVARLMGMDTLPSEINTAFHAEGWKDEKPRSSVPRKEPTEVCSSHHTSSLCSTPFKQAKQDFLPFATKRDSTQSTNSLRVTKPHPRDHPQEELLQKFKEEFESWQASMVWEHSRTLELDNTLRQGKVNQILALENLNKDKMARYLDTKRDSACKKPKDHASTAKLKVGTEQGSCLRPEGYRSRQSKSDLRNGMTLRSREETGNFTQLSLTKFDKKHNRSSSLTRIVVLKPSSERSDDIEESYAGSPDILEEEGSMEEFLEEVKERLKSEILGKARNEITAREIGTGTSFRERSTDTKQFARHIAKQIRESVTRDLGTTLIRSESTRSYRSEVFDGPDSPEFNNRDTRKLLSERLKNVVKNETNVGIPSSTNGRSRLVEERARAKSMHDYSKLGKNMSDWEDKKTLTESETRSFRHEQKNGVVFDAVPVSPRNLVRSFSAPVSGTAFGKLLLEDQHVLTGAHIRRKHEESQHSSADFLKKRRDGFNLKGTVSNWRQNLTLKGKLFQKKIQLVDESAGNEFDPMKAIVTAPSFVVNCGIVQDNSTEVPPSPASVCSSSRDGYCRPGHPSPVSPLEVPFIEGHPTPQASEEISSNLPAPRNLPEEQVEHGGSEEMEIEVKPYEDSTVEVEGQAEAYVRDILITAGLYEGGAFDQAFSKWDALTKQISMWVFEEVEDVYSKKHKVDEGGSLLCCGDTNLGHKMLFDLTNEALPRVLKTPMTRSTFKKWILGPEKVSHGKALLDGLWHQIKMYTNTPLDESRSLDSMVVCDVRMTPWFCVLHEDLDAMGREMEWVILGDLIDEFLWEMWLL